MATNDKTAKESAATADAQVSPATTNTQADVARDVVEPYSTTTADAVDPATGDKFKAGAPGVEGPGRVRDRRRGREHRPRRGPEPDPRGGVPVGDAGRRR
jgi:hypothetical protein